MRSIKSTKEIKLKTRISQFMLKDANLKTTIYSNVSSQKNLTRSSYIYNSSNYHSWHLRWRIYIMHKSNLLEEKCKKNVKFNFMDDFLNEPTYCLTTGTDYLFISLMMWFGEKFNWLFGWLKLGWELRESRIFVKSFIAFLNQ